MEGDSPNGSSDSSGILVTVLNETDETVDVDRWADLVRAVLDTEGVRAPAETNVVFVDRDTIADLNAEHMGKRGPTDVLSFPLDDESDRLAPDDVRLVGDIVVCGSVATENAPGHAGNPDDEVALLLVHGTLHLLGHDHAEEEERDVMWAAERRLLDAHWRPLVADPWAVAP